MQTGPAGTDHHRDNLHWANHPVDLLVKNSQEGQAMIDQQTINEAVRRLLDAVPVGSEVILFGSWARGEAGEDSDLDFLVVEPTLASRREEMVRLRQVLRPLGVPADVLVVSREAFDSWKDAPNNVVSHAAREGRSFTRAA